MRRKKSVARKKTGAAKKVWLISDAKLMALHRRLLKAMATGHGNGSGARNEMERFAAARVALWFDLKAPDKVVEAKVGDPMSDALQAASRNKARKNRRIVVAWGNDGQSSWQSALEDARARLLPMLFVCEARDGRLGSMGLPRANSKLRPGEELPCIAVDGHDVVAAYRVAHEAVERARRDRGPTLILLATYKVSGRTYTDAVADMERYLLGRGLLKAEGRRPEQAAREAPTKAPRTRAAKGIAK